ncbi:MAG: hypothetical protein V3U68_06925, partial [Bacteroidota bacterium]
TLECRTSFPPHSPPEREPKPPVRAPQNPKVKLDIPWQQATGGKCASAKIFLIVFICTASLLGMTDGLLQHLFIT